MGEPINKISKYLKNDKLTSDIATRLINCVYYYDTQIRSTSNYYRHKINTRSFIYQR